MRRMGGFVVAALMVALIGVDGIDVGPALAAISTIDVVTPPNSSAFGYDVLVLSNGNYVVTDPDADGDRGAVHLYDGLSNQLISSVRGSTPGNRVGYDGVLEVGDGNFIVLSPLWDNGMATDAGALTWVDGVTGLDGVVSPQNSLVGTSPGDGVGFSSTQALPNGNYVAATSKWGLANQGAVTWGNGNSGIVGPVSAANSLVGSHTDDMMNVQVIPLLNSNVVIRTPLWDSDSATDVGAVTWFNGATGIAGTISAEISLVGTTTGDKVGLLPGARLTNGSFVVSSPMWDGVGAVDGGAATWIDGSTGRTGPVSLANSLIGQAPGDQISNYGITALTNGHYVVGSSDWHNGVIAQAGAATWGNGETGTTGFATTANSIHGTFLADKAATVTPLSNGNYVVASPTLDIDLLQDSGGAMWASGGGPTATAITGANSIHGTAANDQVGQSTTALTNGSYVVVSGWQTGGVAVGATTWADGGALSSFAVNPMNSLVNSQAGDSVNIRVEALANGNYIVRSPNWSDGGTAKVGAVTWGSGISGVKGSVSTANSLIGTTANDNIGLFAGVLPNGNAVVSSYKWDNAGAVDAGMVRVISGIAPTTGTVDPTNSLVGSHAMDLVGIDFVVLADGNAVALTGLWDDAALADVGAVTWLDAAGGPTGAISTANSIVGLLPGDQIGDQSPTLLPDGAFVFRSSRLDVVATNSGAVTYVEPGGTVGRVTAANSVFGSTMNQGTEFVTGIAYTAADAVVIGRWVDKKVTIMFPPDSKPPTFGPVSNVTVAAAPGEAGAVVNYALPTAFDARGAPTVVCSPPPGSFFPIGDTTVSCVATDTAGLTATTSFTLTVAGDYVPLPPVRLADTRDGFATVDGINAGGGLRDVGSTLELQVAGRGGVDLAASAVTLNVTAVDAVAPGFATVWPCGEPRPTASNLNFATGATVPNAVIAKIGADGKVCLFTSQPIHFVVDVNGYAPAATSYRPLNPGRLLDTRADGVTSDGAQQRAGAVTADSTTALHVVGRGGVPDDATSVVLNVTTTESAADGYVTVFPCGTARPNASSVNGVARATVANLVIAKVGSGGDVCLYSQSPTHLIADVNGYFAPGGAYMPIVPARLMDSRPGSATVDGSSAGAGTIALGTVTSLTVNGRGGVPNAATVVLNVTVTEPEAAGYVTAYPCGPSPGNTDPPNASNVNFAAGQTVANGALVKVGTGGTVCFYNSQPTQLVVDVAGYFPA